MAVNNPAGSSPLVLAELDVPGRTGPVSQNPDVWGLNIAAVQDNFPRQGLLCRAGPWGVMSQGDKLVISLGGQSVFNKTVDEHEVNTTLSMFVPAARFSDGSSTLSYAVTRQGGTPEPSEVMQVRVKLTRPGGHDSDGGPGHPNLKMTIPKEILEGGIDKDNVAAGVWITIGPSDDGPEPYLNAAAGDWIQVTWGGVFVLYGPLTQDEADGKVPVVVHVTEQDIRDAEDSGDAGLAVAFEVYDAVDNRSEDWSHEQRVVVAVDADRLGAPLCKETLNNVLDADKLGDADGTAQILAVDGSKFKVGDTPIVRLKGTPVEGAPINIEVTGEPLVNVPSIPEIKIPNAALRQLAKTQIGLSFRLKKADGSADLLSKTQFINVIGEIKRLLAPVARDALQGALDPDLPQARIEIPFDKSFVAGQAIRLFWLGTRPDLSTYLPDLLLRPITDGDIRDGVPLRINVPGLHLKQIEGGKLELYYHLLSEDAVLGTMNRVNATHAIRESIHAEILNVGDPKKELPEPKVDGVVDGVLPEDTDGTTLTVEYLNTVKDDEVTYFWNGSKTGPDSDWIKLSSFTAGQPVPFPIKAELIKGNEGGTIEASYYIKWADGRPTSYSDVKTFSVGVALDLTAPHIKEAPNDTSLVPNAAKDALTAIVDFVGMKLQDEIIVTWTGAAGAPAGGSHTAPKKTVTVLGPQEIPLANSVVAFNLNKAVTVSYTMKRGSATPLPSGIRTLAVQSLALDLSNVPKIVQAANNGDGTELDLSLIKTAAIVHAPRWDLIALRQYVWLRLKGTLASGGDYEKTLFTAPTSVTNPNWVAPGGYYDYNIPVAVLNELQGLKDATSLVVEFKAALGGSPNEAEAVPFPLRTYTVKAIPDVKPVITKAEDSKGDEILPGDYTVDTSVTLIGTAAKGQKVQLRDDATPDGQPTADPGTGIWRHTLNGRTLTLHTFTAKALYGSGLTSDPRSLTVTEATEPTITSVKGLPSNVEIPNAGYTVETSVILTGAAAKGQKVDVLDGTTSKDQPVADPTTGIWTLKVTGLTATAHSFTAKALYGPGQVSLAWNLTVRLNIRTIPVPYCSRMAINSSGTRLFVTTHSPTGSTSTVTVIDLVTWTVIKVHSDKYIWPIAVSPDENYVYFRIENSQFSVMDARNLTVLRNVPTASLAIDDIAFSPTGQQAYLSGTTNSTNQLTIINPSNFQTITTISLQRGGGRIAVSPDSNRIYVSNANGEGEGNAKGTVSVIDARSFSLLKHIDVGSNPSKMAVSRDGNFVYALRTLDRVLVVIDSRNLTVTRNISLEAEGIALALDADGGFIYISVGRKIMRMDTTTFNSVTIFEKEPLWEICLSPDKKTLYGCSYLENLLYAIPIK